MYRRHNDEICPGHVTRPGERHPHVFSDDVDLPALRSAIDVFGLGWFNWLQ